MDFPSNLTPVFFDKDLAIYIPPVTLYPIEVVLGGDVLLFNMQL